MKISKQIFLLALILFLFFASGCSKNLILPGDLEPDSGVTEAEVDTSSPGGFEKPGPGPDFGSAQQGMPGDGAAGSFSAEPFGGEAKPVPDTGTPFAGFEKPGPGPDFGSAQQGMPGNGASGSFSAEPFSGDATPEPDSGMVSKESADSSLGGYEKPGPGPDFGSAQQGMPGNGSSGSFSAEPFKAPEPDSGMVREETVDQTGTPFAGFEKPGPGPDFGSAQQGMPGNGAAGSFSAEPFIDDNVAAAPLPKDEEVRRQLPYSPSDRLEDIHFAFDKYDLDDKARAILQKNADYLKSHPSLKIELQGHCDERGSNNYNMALGERRVRSTLSFLISQGVDESRVHTISYGEERPFCSESNEECWYQNRRGHFLVAE